MIPRGQPFPQGPPVLLACPSCLEADRHSTLAPSVILALGPGERQDALRTPFVRYRCEACGYREVHPRLIRRRT